MNGVFEGWLGKWPENYVYETLKRAGLKGPPYDEFEIAHSLGIRIEQYSPESEIGQWFDQTAWSKSWVDASGTCMKIIGKQPIIFTPSHFSPERKRMNIFHECGHAILPWHVRECHLCLDKDIAPSTYKLLEQEAFYCASTFLMPRYHFLKDVKGLQSTSFASIEILRKRYHVSFEATACWYVKNHPGICGLVVLEPVNRTEPEDEEVEVIPLNQEFLPIGLSAHAYRKIEFYGCRFKTSYAVRSQRFPHKLKRNYGIHLPPTIQDAWQKCKPANGEISGNHLGWFNTAPLRYECKPIGGYKQKMMLLLWEEDPQPPLLIHMGHYAA